MPIIPLLFLLTFSVSSNLRFSLDLILGNKIKSGGDKSEEYGGGGDIILESLVLPTSALLILQCEVSRFHARRNSFLFPEADFLTLRII
jgi:hypothetical protein